jgi:predicted nucleic acid-binding protein
MFVERSRSVDLSGINLIKQKEKHAYLSLLRFINPLSIVDAYAAATAQKQSTTLIIGTDKELDELTIKLLKIRKK